MQSERDNALEIDIAPFEAKILLVLDKGTVELKYVIAAKVLS